MKITRQIISIDINISRYWNLDTIAVNFQGNLFNRSTKPVVVNKAFRNVVEFTTCDAYLSEAIRTRLIFDHLAPIRRSKSDCIHL